MNLQHYLVYATVAIKKHDICAIHPDARIPSHFQQTHNAHTCISVKGNGPTLSIKQ